MRISLLMILLAVAGLLWGTNFHSAAAVPPETIRVAIVKNAGTVTVDGDGLLAVQGNGEPLALAAPVSVTAGKDCVMVNGVMYHKLTFAASAAVTINGKPYRGIAELLPDEKGILVVNQLPLEAYLVGLINREISSAWPIEAVKAQAVIARTYALNRKATPRDPRYHLESTVMDQVYDGSLVEDSRAQQAVDETAGEVLTYNNAIIQAFYHSSCGGRTESAENVWGTALPYLKGVACEYCLNSPSVAWEQKLSLRDIEEKLKSAGFKVAGLTDIKAGPRDESGRLRSVRAISDLGDAVVSGEQFRKAIGYGIIKSTNFTVTVANGGALFSGYGNGHGVGLCQWGAKQRAQDGFSYAEILSYYYPGTRLQQFFDIK